MCRMDLFLHIFLCGHNGKILRGYTTKEASYEGFIVTTIITVA